MTGETIPRGVPGIAVQARDRILKAATFAFSNRGFHGVTVRDLAQQAEVNLAAINYHFRSKDVLYAAVIDGALAQWVAETAVIDDLAEESPLAHVIRLLVSALIAPVIEREDGPLLPRLIAWDLLQGNGQSRIATSPAVTTVIRNRIAPYFPPAVSGIEMDLIASWLVSQCLLLSPTFRPGSTDKSPEFAALEMLAEQISQLALNGIGGFLATRR
jgi:AcrR family transcriptional regulator